MTHDPVLHSQVRALSWRMASGEISWSDHRERRFKLVRAITAGETALEYKMPVVKEDATTPKEHEVEQTFINIDELDNPTPPNRLPAYIAVGLLVGLLALVGWVLWQSSEPPVVATAPVVERGAAEALLDSFVRSGEWTQESIEALVADWRQQSVEQRQQVRSTVVWRRMQNQLREQVNQQQVLVSVDETGEAQATLDSLRNLQQVLTNP